MIDSLKEDLYRINLCLFDIWHHSDAALCDNLIWKLKIPRKYHENIIMFKRYMFCFTVWGLVLELNFGLHACNTIILNRYGSSKLLYTLILYYSFSILSTLVPLESFPWWWWWYRERSDQWPARVAWQPAGSPKQQQLCELHVNI